MAFTAGKSKEIEGKSNDWLLDQSLMQSMQDRFCDANNVYMVCLNAQNGVVTKAYGTKEELEYVYSKAGRERHVSLLDKMTGHSIESVVEEPLDTDSIKMSGVAIHVSGETIAVWIVIGIMDNSTEDIPDYMMRTSPERYYKSLEFLESLSKQIFAVKMEEVLAQEAFNKSRESETQMKEQLHRNEAMTSILKMLESENSFTKIVDDILKDACEYLGISAGALLRENQEQKTVDMICEYAGGGREPQMAKEQGVPKEELPFFNGKPYMISSDSMMPEGFARLFAQKKLTAAVFLPVEVNGHAGMYLCFCESEKKKKWENADVKFINDVKRIIQTILTKRITKNSLASSYASLEAILENVGCAIYVRDPQTGHILYANEKYQKFFKKTLEELPLSPVSLQDATETKNGLFREIYSEKENRWFDCYSTHIQWVDGRKVTLCTIYDVTDKKLYQQKIEKQANNDFLTGLYNRMRCEQDLQHFVEDTHESGGEGALLYIDLDDFKHINDGLGHQYGDILLKNISSGLKQIPGVNDNCYRMGGDEFIILISHKVYPNLHNIIDRIKAEFARPWRLKGTEYYCTMSMGVVRFPTDGDSVEELIKKADIAMYEAKKTGKNRVATYREGIDSVSGRRLDMEKNMRDATVEGYREFEVYYQPIIDIQGGRDVCAGAEALIRWNSAKLGFISPAEFIPLAEYLGLINPIGNYVLTEACTRCKRWNESGYPNYKVNVNLSVVQLLQPDIVETVEKALADTGLSPKNLTLEVTESLAINDMERMKEILNRIKSLGVSLALDDFGTGYSSLNHIREIPIDVIKVDQSFVKDLAEDAYSQSFIKMVAELAETIGVSVCVEGIETPEQFRVLQGMKVKYIQGYYFDRPLERHAFEEKYVK